MLMNGLTNLKTDAYIDRKFVSSISGYRFVTLNPADGEVAPIDKNKIGIVTREPLGVVGVSSSVICETI